MEANLGAEWILGLLVLICVVLLPCFNLFVLFSSLVHFKNNVFSFYSNSIISTFHMTCLRPRDLGHFATFDISLMEDTRFKSIYTF
uniref:Putative ovule protein n=1 Tax=Solanum chacoense TaxID=4108 RepID=A0A0V0HBW5_SOLCH